MIRVGLQQPVTHKRLPVLYLSCRDSLADAPRSLSLIGRLVDSKNRIDAVVFITASADSGQPHLLGPASAGPLKGQLSARLSKLGYPLVRHGNTSTSVVALASMLFEQPPVDYIELRLSVAMNMEQCRELGQALQGWRESKVLLVCLDHVPLGVEPHGYRSPHDPYWRNLMNQWVDEQRWYEALSDSALQAHPSPEHRQRSLDDASLCLLHTAFGLGGLRLPERLFGFDLDDNQRALSGYGWMS
ncbi:hypothetical protein [Halopseudomonas sp.]|uniref:hypothetical protein n=1 Tax=Halopseudomonas sp. TaxID=2901191 RepID=UPI0035657C5B